MSRVIPPIEWPAFEADIEAILRLKRERGAIILAHNYQSPEIFHCVADVVGDSLALAREAAKSEARVIVMAGVHFMAETAKLLNPTKTVLIPDPRAGCSLAESITPEDIALLRQAYPGAPVVTYVNTSAAVKAASDICCTSANALKVVESLGVPRVIMTPDEYLAKNVAAQTKVEIIAWRGRCEVHEQFTARDIREMREAYPGAVVLAHPECSPEVVAEADFRGLDRRDDRLCRGQAAGARRAGDRVLDERQRLGPLSRRRVRQALRPLSAHEADHARQDPPRARDDGGRSDDRSRRSPRPRGAPSSGCWRCDRRASRVTPTRRRHRRRHRAG